MKTVDIKLNQHDVVEDHRHYRKVSDKLRQPIMDVMLWQDWRNVSHAMYGKTRRIN